MDKEILSSAYSADGSALNNELHLVTLEQPGLFQPEQDRVTAFKATLGGPLASFEDSSQLQFSPEYWYFKKPA